MNIIPKTSSSCLFNRI